MDVTQALRDEIAPYGRLRVALNHGNRVLLGRDRLGRPQGISVDLAQALVDWLGLGLEFVEFDRAGDVTAAAREDLWDVGFLAIDPERAEIIDFTSPYVGIEGRYLASASCTVRDAGELVSSASKVGTVRGSAYTLTLQRKPGSDHLVVYPDFGSMMAGLEAGEVCAVAGIGDVMAREASWRPGARVLSPPFMEIRQALAIVKGRPKALDAVQQFLLDLARTGTIGEILERHGVSPTCAILPE